MQASNQDYSRSGYDRGHLAAAANMRMSTAAMEQSFYLTNMVPQTPALNRGEWAALEELVRDKVEYHKPIYVISGPIYIGNPTTIGGRVQVPTHMFKIVYNKEDNVVASYIMPNTVRLNGRVEHFYVSLSEVQRLANIEIFPRMPLGVRNSIKQKPISSW